LTLDHSLKDNGKVTLMTIILATVLKAKTDGKIERLLKVTFSQKGL